MKLSKTSAQAALAVAYLASHTGASVVQAREVAEHLCIPTDSALKILQALTQHGLVESRLGRSGGYRFVGKSDRVTLLQIIEAIDGPLRGQIPAINASDHLMGRLGLLRSVCEQVTRQARQQLQRTAVADLLRCEGATGLRHRS